MAMGRRQLRCDQEDDRGRGVATETISSTDACHGWSATNTRTVICAVRFRLELEPPSVDPEREVCYRSRRLLGAGHGRLRAWRRCCWSCRARNKSYLHRGGNLIGIGQKLAHLPELGVGEAALEAGHAGEANAVFGEPVGLPDRIIAHAGAVEKLRGLGIHAVGDGGLWLGGKPVANGAVLLVDFGAGEEIFFIGWYR